MNKAIRNTTVFAKGSALALAVGLAMSVSMTAQAAGTDEVILKDGSRILGTVTSARDGKFTIETDFAGAIEVSADKVETVRGQGAAVLLMEDESVVTGGPLRVENGQVQTPSGTGYALESLSILNPEPWELGQGYHWKGLANLGWVAQRGNTDTDELDYRLESYWESTRDRYTLLFGGENDENNGTKTARNWKLHGKYDHFLVGPNYWGVQAMVEKDKFANIDRRIMAGPYIGREFFTDPIFRMAGEIGVSYVDEKYIDGEDDDYTAATWAFKGTSNVLGGISELYFTQNGIWNLDETSDVVVDTTLGLAFPLMWQLEAAAELKLDYNSGVDGDIDELDQTYRLRVGYSW